MSLFQYSHQYVVLLAMCHQMANILSQEKTKVVKSVAISNSKNVGVIQPSTGSVLSHFNNFARKEQGRIL